MNFNVEISMEEFASDGRFDEIGFIESIRSEVEDKVANKIISDMVGVELHWYHGDLRTYAKKVVSDQIEKVFLNKDFIDGIKNEIASSIAERITRKKELAESQFGVEKFADLSPSNRKYLLTLVEEVMVKRLKGLQ